MKCRAFLAGAVTLALAFSCRAEETLTVAWYGGVWGDAFNACIALPFTEATGIKVRPEIGTSNVTLAKLKQQKEAPTIDVAFMDGGVSELAAEAGVLDHLRPEAINNMKAVAAEAVYAHNGQTFAVGAGYYIVGIAYNPDKVKQPPTSWADLWKPDYADAVLLPSPANATGAPLLIFLNQVFGGGEDSTKVIFDRLKTLKPALYFDSSGAASTAFQTGEAVIGAQLSPSALSLAAKGVPLRFIVPKEGALAIDARLHLVQGSKHSRAAEKFIDTALTPAAARCLAEKLFLTPAVKGVELAPDLAEKMPWIKSGGEALKHPDWKMVNALRAEIVDQWNRSVAGN